MDVWMVFVKVKSEGNLRHRYLDSIWAVKKSAIKRRQELDNSFTQFGCSSSVTGLVAELLEASVADTAIQSPVSQQEADSDAQGGQ